MMLSGAHFNGVRKSMGDDETLTFGDYRLEKVYNDKSEFQGFNVREISSNIILLCKEDDDEDENDSRLFEIRNELNLIHGKYSEHDDDQEALMFLIHCILLFNYRKGVPNLAGIDYSCQDGWNYILQKKRKEVENYLNNRKSKIRNFLNE